MNNIDPFSSPLSLPHLGLPEEASDPQLTPVNKSFSPVNSAAVSLQGRVNVDPPSNSRPTKVSNSHFLFTAGAFFICVWAVANMWWTPIARLFTYVQHKSLFDGIEKAQIAKLSEGLSTIIEEEWLGMIVDPKKPGYTILNLPSAQLLQNIRLLRPNANEKEVSELVEKVVQIKEMVQKLEKEGGSLRLDVSSVQSLISETLKLPLYLDLKQERNCYAVNFVQCLAIKLVSTDATEALADYGKKCLGEEMFKNPDRSFSPKELADQLSGYLNRFSFNADAFGPIKEGRLIWMAAHPLRAIHGLYSNTHPLFYDGTQSNPYFSNFALIDPDTAKKLDFYFGPGPTGSPFFEHGVLPAYEKFDTFEMRFNHQNMHNKGDYPRIQDAIRIEMESSNLFHAVFSFDKPWAKAVSKKAFTTSDTFFDAIKPRVMNGLHEIRERKKASGLYIPENLLDPSQVEMAFTKAKEFCKNLGVANPHWRSSMRTEEGKDRMRKMMVHIADSFLMLGLVYKSFDMITPEMVQNQMNDLLDQDLFALRVSGACKQDVDRAVVSNITLRLFYRWTLDPSPLSADEVCEIAGAVFARARFVDDRNMLKRRYQILDDLLRFVGDAQGTLKAHTVLSQYRREAKESLQLLTADLTESETSGGIISSLWRNPASWFSQFKRAVIG